MKKQQIVKGWKVFNNDLKCRDFQYEVGKTYKIKGNVVICQNGFHFHENIADLWNYYSFDENNKVCEIEAKNVTTGNDKSVCGEITIIRLMTWDEVLKVGNNGQINTGWRNTGNRNTGDMNTGNRNTGDRNTGSWNTGSRNTGSWNTGDMNTGNRNTGDMNTGNWNTGNWNTGNWNPGDMNTGSWNTGDMNTGNWNTGDFNSCNYSSGLFNSVEQKVSLFNGAATVLMSKFRNTKEYSALFSGSFNLTIWINESEMIDKEKEDHKLYYVQQGYLKSFDYKDACKNWWNTISESNKKLIQSIPGFDKNIFFDITGISV